MNVELFEVPTPVRRLKKGKESKGKGKSKGEGGPKGKGGHKKVYSHLEPQNTHDDYAATDSSISNGDDLYFGYNAAPSDDYIVPNQINRGSKSDNDYTPSYEIASVNKREPKAIMRHPKSDMDYTPSYGVPKSDNNMGKVGPKGGKGRSKSDVTYTPSNDFPSYKNTSKGDSKVSKPGKGKKGASKGSKKGSERSKDGFMSIKDSNDLSSAISDDCNGISNPGTAPSPVQDDYVPSKPISKSDDYIHSLADRKSVV